MHQAEHSNEWCSTLLRLWERDARDARILRSAANCVTSYDQDSPAAKRVRRAASDMESLRDSTFDYASKAMKQFDESLQAVTKVDVTLSAEDHAIFVEASTSRDVDDEWRKLMKVSKVRFECW